MKRRFEIIPLATASLLWGGGALARTGRGLPMDWTAPALYAPTGLLFLVWLNFRLRSRVLAWGVFALALTLAMIVFGAWALVARTDLESPWVNAGAATLLYAALAAAAALQLRVDSPQETSV